jgi:hypothetical protein
LKTILMKKMKKRRQSKLPSLERTNKISLPKRKKSQYILIS